MSVAVLLATLLVGDGRREARAEAAVPLASCYSSDNGDPVVTKFDISPRSLDLRDRRRIVTATASVTDTGGPGPESGIAGVRLVLSSGGHMLTKVDEGFWSVGFVVAPGQWWPGPQSLGLVVWDMAGNSRYVSAQELAALGGNAAVDVQSPRDQKDPVLRGLRLSATTVDTRTRPANVRIVARLTDDLSGVRTVRLRALGGFPLRTRLREQAGTSRAGTWAGTLRVPTWVGDRSLDLALIARDRAGNRTKYAKRRLNAMGLPVALRTRSRWDATRPVVVSSVVTPAALDVRSQDGEVIVDVRARDDRAPVLGGQVWSSHGPGREFRADLRLVRGTRHDGLWRARLEVSRCSAVTGTWDVNGFLSGRGGSRNLSAIGSVEVTAGDNQRPEARPVYGSQPTGPSLSLHFTEEVTGISSESAVARRQVPGGSPVVVAGTWQCRDTTSTVISCDGTTVRSAEFLPATGVEVGASYEVQLNPDHHLDVRDLAGNPADPDARLVLTPPPTG